jgi:archaellum component FlaG (FlaF/FlaG flagellin family)
MLTFRYFLTIVAAVVATAAVAAVVSGAFYFSHTSLVSAAASIAAEKAAHLDTPVAVRLYPANYTYINGRWILIDRPGLVPVYILGLGQCPAYSRTEVRITGTKIAVYTSNNTQDLRPSIVLKIFDLTDYWMRGYRSVTVQVNPAGTSFTLTAPEGPFLADFLLAWEDCHWCDDRTPHAMYVDEVWRLTFTPSGPVLTRINSHGDFWHEVYADGQLIYTWNKDGPKNDRYVGTNPTIAVRFVSPDSTMNAEAAFTIDGTFRGLFGMTYTSRNTTVVLTNCVLVMPWVDGNVITHYAATCRSGTDFRPEAAEAEASGVRIRLVVVNC